MATIFIHGIGFNTPDAWDSCQCVEGREATTEIATACLLVAITGVRDRAAALLGHFLYPILDVSQSHPIYNPKLTAMLWASQSRFPDGRKIVARGLGSDSLERLMRQFAQQRIVTELLLHQQHVADVLDVQWSGMNTGVELRYDADVGRGRIFKVEAGSAATIDLLQMQKSFDRNFVESLQPGLVLEEREF